MRIVPLAVKNYFLYDIPVEETIRNHDDIFDFCMQLKCNSASIGRFSYMDGNDIKIKDLDRMTRYYISNSKESGTLSKFFINNERVVGVNVGYSAIIFNKYIKKDIKDYKIDYSFYINEANKLKNTIMLNERQLNLFDL